MWSYNPDHQPISHDIDSESLAHSSVRYCDTDRLLHGYSVCTRNSSCGHTATSSGGTSSC